jgi:hypothetical protein
MRVAGEHFVAQRKAIEGDHQRDAHLLAIGAVIARVAALRLRIALGLPFEVGRGEVIQQHVIVHGKQLPHPPAQVRLKRRFMRQQLVERAIQPILVHQRLVQLQQITERRASIPVLGNVQLAGGLT